MESPIITHLINTLNKVKDAHTSFNPTRILISSQDVTKELKGSYIVDFLKKHLPNDNIDRTTVNGTDQWVWKWDKESGGVVCVFHFEFDLNHLGTTMKLRKYSWGKWLGIVRILKRVHTDYKNSVFESPVSCIPLTVETFNALIEHPYDTRFRDLSRIAGLSTDLVLHKVMSTGEYYSKPRTSFMFEDVNRQIFEASVQHDATCGDGGLLILKKLSSPSSSKDTEKEDSDMAFTQSILKGGNDNAQPDTSSSIEDNAEKEEYIAWMNILKEKIENDQPDTSSPTKEEYYATIKRLKDEDHNEDIIELKASIEKLRKEHMSMTFGIMTSMIAMVAFTTSLRKKEESPPKEGSYIKEMMAILGGTDHNTVLESLEIVVFKYTSHLHSISPFGKDGDEASARERGMLRRVIEILGGEESSVKKVTTIRFEMMKALLE